MDPIQVYKIVTRDGRTFIIEEYAEECECEVCLESAYPPPHEAYIEYQWAELRHDSSFMAYDGATFYHLGEAVEDVRNKIAICDTEVEEEFENTTRAGWEQYHGNDIRWPNWTPTKGDTE